MLNKLQFFVLELGKISSCDRALLPMYNVSSFSYINGLLILFIIFHNMFLTII